MGSDGGCLMVCGAEYAGEKKRKEGREEESERSLTKAELWYVSSDPAPRNS